MKPRVIGWIAAIGRESPEKSFMERSYILFNTRKQALKAAQQDLKDYPTANVYRIFKVEAVHVLNGKRLKPPASADSQRNGGDES